MNFLDVEIEKLLKEILENDEKFPKILREKFNGLNHIDDSKLRSKIKVLIDEGYISKLQWGDNVPLLGRIEQKGYSYFKNKEIYIRKALREDARFDLDIESETALKNLIELFYSNGDPYILITKRNCSAQILNLLAQKGLIELGKHGISFDLSGNFTCMYMITQRGKNYFIDKEQFIEEILAFPDFKTSTIVSEHNEQYNIQSGDNSPIIMKNSGTISIEYDFEQSKAAIDEIRQKIDELGATDQKKQEILDNLDTAEMLIKQKKKHPLKTIMKGVYDILKDIGCSIISSLIISKMGL